MSKWFFNTGLRFSKISVGVKHSISLAVLALSNLSKWFWFELFPCCRFCDFWDQSLCAVLGCFPWRAISRNHDYATAIRPIFVWRTHANTIYGQVFYDNKQSFLPLFHYASIFRFVVLHKPHCPHAWCDTLRVVCVTDDKAESWGELGNPQWTTVATTDEMVNTLKFCFYNFCYKCTWYLFLGSNLWFNSDLSHRRWSWNGDRLSVRIRPQNRSGFQAIRIEFCYIASSTQKITSRTQSWPFNYQKSLWSYWRTSASLLDNHELGFEGSSRYIFVARP